MNGRKPTKAEQKWLTAIVELGCCVCRNEMGLYSPAEPHHLNGCRKEGCHFETIPLCPNHHRGGHDSIECISRHTNKYRFQLKYGSEKSLLKQLQDEIGENDEFK